MYFEERKLEAEITERSTTQYFRPLSLLLYRFPGELVASKLIMNIVAYA
jgi:hypothetical protein